MILKELCEVLVVLTLLADLNPHWSSTLLLGLSPSCTKYTKSPWVLFWYDSVVLHDCDGVA